MKKVVISVGAVISFFVVMSVAFAQPYTPLAPLPGTVEVSGSTNISTYLSGMIKLLIALGGALSIVMAIIGGTQYIAAGSLPDAKSGAKERIANALVGLALVLTSYLILNSINPKLVQFSFMLPPVGVSPMATTTAATGSGVHVPLPLSINPLIHGAASNNSFVWQPIVSTSSTASAQARAQQLLNERIDRNNDYSIISNCVGSTSYDLCPRTDLNHDGVTNAEDMALFMTQGNTFDVNQNQTVELANTSPSAAKSCFFKKNNTAVSSALANHEVLLNGQGYLAEQVTPTGISLGYYDETGGFTVARVGRTVSGHATGYRDSSVVATSTAPLPTASITVTSTSLVGTSANIAWSSTGATSCSASGGWSGTIGVSGSMNGTLSRTQPTSYYLTCRGEGGVVSVSATMNLSNANIWIRANELNSACAVDSGLINMPFGFVYRANGLSPGVAGTDGQYSNFKIWVNSVSSGYAVNLSHLLIKTFFRVDNTGEGMGQLVYNESDLGKLTYATIAQYDLNNDGTADFSSGGADMAAFNACKGSAVQGACAQADFNGDGVIDDRDSRFVKFMQDDIFGNSGYTPLGWKLNWFESMMFDPTGYTDKQIINYCLGRTAFEKCGVADMNGDNIVNSADIGVFDTSAPTLDFNSDGSVNLPARP